MRGIEKQWTHRFVWGSTQAYGLELARDWDRPAFDTSLAICPGPLHQRFDAPPQRPRATAAIQSGPVIPHPSVERFDPRAFFQPVGAAAGRAARLASLCPPLQPPRHPGCLDAQPVSGTRRRERVAPDQRAALGTLVAPKRGPGGVRRSDRCDGFGGRLFRAQKKTTGKYSASRAALGGRTLKCGQSRCFVGYKKHTLQLWLRQYRRGVLLVPLVTWVAPANYGEGGFLKPSVIYCQRRWDWYPNIIVADMGYIEAATKRQLRETRAIAVVTRLKENMLLVPPFESCERAVCGQGQRLQWLGYEAADQLHWFGVTDTNPLCQWCWESAQCARQFSHDPAEHETLLGLIPMNTRVSQRLLQ